MFKISILVVTLLTSSFARADQCKEASAVPGALCDGGAIYAGTYNKKRYMVTPGNCTDSATPICNGGPDGTQKKWGAYGVSAETKSSDDGAANTRTLVTRYSGTEAAQYCDQMVFGGYSDWFLPAENELYMIKQNARLIGSFVDEWYWTSTQTTWTANPNYEKPIARVMGMGYTSGTNMPKDNALHVRCVRIVKP